MKTFRTLFVFLFFATGAQAGALKAGMEAWGKNDFETAISHLQPLADSGNAEAQFVIGHMHGTGAGFQKNRWIALAWLGMAARQGHLRAQTTLAEKYMSGTNGAPQNFTAAAKWYKRAAEAGQPEAQFRLGQLYAEGRGVKRDFVAAHVWFNLAAAQGHIGAAAKRSVVSLKLTPAQITQAQKIAGSWVRK